MEFQAQYLEELRQSGALDKNGNLLKYRLTSGSVWLYQWALHLSDQFAGDGIDTVAANADDALGFAHFMATHLSIYNVDRAQVRCIGAWPVNRTILVADRAMSAKLRTSVRHYWAGPPLEFDLNSGDELTIQYEMLAIRNEDIELVRSRRVLVVQDRITTGRTTGRVIEAVRRANGEVVGVGALIRQGQATAEQLGVPKLKWLIDLPAAVEVKA